MSKLNIGTVLVELVLEDKASPKVKEAEKTLNAMGSGLASFAGQLDSLLTAAFKRAAQAAAALATASAVVGANFEKQMSKVAAISGASAEGMKALTEEARRIGETTAFSATQAAEGMEQLAQAGFTVPEIITATSDAMSLAGATGLGLAEATELVAASIQQFGLSAADAGKVADVLTQGSQSSLFSIQDLSVAMRYGGSVGKAFGKSLEETVAAMAQFRNIGLTGEQSGTNFRAMMEALGNPTKIAREQIEALGLTMEQLDPKLHSMDEIMKVLGDANMNVAESFAIFGTVAGGNVANLVEQFKAGKDSYKQMVEEMKNSNGTASRTFALMADNVAGRFEQLKSAIEEMLLTLFDSMKGPLTNLINGLIERVDFLTARMAASGKTTEERLQAMVDGILKLTDTVIKFIPYAEEVAVAMFAAWVGAKGVVWLTAIGQIASAAGIDLTGALKKVVTGLKGLGFAGSLLTVAGIAAVIVQLAALVQAFVQLTTQLSGAAREARELEGALKGVEQFGEEKKAQSQALTDMLQATQDEIGMRLRAGEAISQEEKLLLKLNAAQAEQLRLAGEILVVEGQLRVASMMTVEEREQEIASLQNMSVDYQQLAEAAGKLRQEWEANPGAFLEGVPLGPGLAEMAGIDVFDRIEEAMNSGLLDEANAAFGQNVRTLEDLARVEQLFKLRSEEAGQTSEALTRQLNEVAIAAQDAGSPTTGVGQTAKTTRELAEAQDEAARKTKAAADEFKQQKEAAEDLAVSMQGPMAEANLEYERQLDLIQEWADAGVDQKTIVDALQSAWEKWNLVATQGAQVNQALDREWKETTETLDKAGASFDELLGMLESMAGRINVGTLAVAEMQEALAQLANNVGKDVGAAIMNFLGQFKDAIVGVIGTILDLTGVLDFVSTFREASEATAEWKEELKKLEEELARLQENGSMSELEADKAMAAFLAESPKPGSPAEQAGAAAAMQTAFVTGLVAALPQMIEAILAELPTLVTAILVGVLQIVATAAQAIPDLLEALTTGIVDFLAQSPALVQAILSRLPEIVQAVVAMVPQLVTAIIVAIPALITALITELPKIMLELALMAPNLIAALIAELPNLFIGLWEGLKKMAEDLVAFVLDIFTGSFFGFSGDNAGEGGLGGFGNNVKNAWDAITGIFKGKRGRSAEGTPWVPFTQLRVLEPGEGVIDALSNWERLRTNLAGPGPIPQGGGGAAASAVEVLVMFEGQVMDAAQARAMDAGKMPQMQRALRSGSGTQIGFNRGRGSVWS